MTHRYFFYPKTPARPRFERDGQAFAILRPVGVQLLTEQELLDRRGTRVGSTEASDTARRFAAAVDALLASESVERYTRMVIDFRLCEVAKLLSYAAAPREILAYFLRDYALAQVEVPRFVGGIYRREQGTVTCEAKVTASSAALSYNASVQRYSREYRGGVEVKVEIAESDFVGSRGTDLSNLRQRILAAMPSNGDSLWSIR